MIILINVDMCGEGKQSKGKYEISSKEQISTNRGHLIPKDYIVV